MSLKKEDKREIGRRGRDPYAVQPRKPSPQLSDKPKPGIGSLQKADIEKNNKIKQVKAKYASLKETARDELTPMKSDRVFSKFRNPEGAKEFYADKPGSKYEGMVKEAMQNKINYYKKMKRGGLTGGQKKLDKNKDGKITGEDFKMMKKGYGAARKDGMGLQDESIKPGKVMKASKGGGADMGRMGELRSKISVAMDRAKRRMSQIPGAISDEERKKIKELLKDVKPARPARPMPNIKSDGPKRLMPSRPKPSLGPMARRMGGGMMQRPMGYSKGTMVMARGCKLGRKKATKLY